MCLFRSRTFVPISWTCKKQASVSHSATEAELMSLDAGLRMMVFHHLICGISSLKSSAIGVEKPLAVPLTITKQIVRINPKPERIVRRRGDQFLERLILFLQMSALRAKPHYYFFEDNEAVIKMAIKERSPTMRHVSCFHRLHLTGFSTGLILIQ